jgi:hypothetical protein
MPSAAAIPQRVQPVNLKDGFNRDAVISTWERRLKFVSVLQQSTIASYQADFDAGITDDATSLGQIICKLVSVPIAIWQGFGKHSYNRINTERTYEDDSTDVPASAFQ